ncbi:MAG: hypothetical protein ACXAC2_24810 [Candidatus Kariarchaeaceae archaeon]|jgi:hypothetical protein
MEIEASTEKFADLMQSALADPVIKKRILEVLQLSSFERRSVLNIWLKQLRLRNARPEMIQALNCLFDDLVAERTLKIIKG